MAFSIGAQVTLLTLTLISGSWSVGATLFTLVNKCSYTIWPGCLSGNGDRALQDGGFVLLSGQSLSLIAPGGWSGRFWGRTGCTFDDSGKGFCSTGDCGNGLKCQQAGGAPPVSLAEFTLGRIDFYDVSLVDGYNVPLSITPLGGTGDCASAGCIVDLRPKCPAELRITSNTRKEGEVIACKSACAAFGSPEYCCTGEHGSPQTCSPTKYSQVFKSACPTAYSYPYDDPTSTFTCSTAQYNVTFCPSET